MRGVWTATVYLTCALVTDIWCLTGLIPASHVLPALLVVGGCLGVAWWDHRAHKGAR